MPEPEPGPRRWRVAAISFLNTAPLLWGLETEPKLQLSYTAPSGCAEQLRREEAEIGIIPVIEMARIAGLAALPGIAVAARAEVRSILLITKTPWPDIRRLALDRSSRTSAALAQILLRRRYGAKFDLAERAPEWREMLDEADAALIIGDPALRLAVTGEAEAAGYRAHDLAAEWHQWTGLPFIFALWAVRRAAVPAGEEAWLTERFQRAKREGLAHADALVQRWARRLDLPAEEIRRYLAHDVEYDITPQHWAGLSRFFEWAAELGLIATPQPPALLA
ncbi:MAG: menaquinone biosynthetic enzyme MqnA/MqnD family protein [Terriglobales bacterium]